MKIKKASIIGGEDALGTSHGGGSRGEYIEPDYKLRQRYAESAFKDNLTSQAGAKGRYQIMPVTLKEYTNRTGLTGNLMDPTFNEQVRD